jgi:ribosome-associated protein
MSDPGPTGGRGVRLAPGVTVDESSLQWTFSRGGGPGGQNVNKVSTRAMLTVELSHLAASMHPDAVERLRALAGQRLAAEPDRLIITSADSRSQHTNRESCLVKLRELVVQAMHRPRRRKKTRPSRGAVQRRLDAKKQRGTRKSERGQDWSG